MRHLTLYACSGLGRSILAAYFQHVGTEPIAQVLLAPRTPRFQPAHLLAALACQPASTQGTFQALRACIDPAVAASAAFWHAFAPSIVVPPATSAAITRMISERPTTDLWPISPHIVEPEHLASWLKNDRKRTL